MPDHEPIPTDLACGEPPLSDELRDALTLLRDRSADDEFRNLVDDVLAGRCGLVDAAATAAFGAAVFAPIAQDLTEHAGRTTDDQPAEAVIDGRSESSAQCAALHRQALGGEPGAAAGLCGGCTGLCSAPCTDPHR